MAPGAAQACLHGCDGGARGLNSSSSPWACVANTAASHLPCMRGKGSSWPPRSMWPFTW